MINKNKYDSIYFLSNNYVQFFYTHNQWYKCFFELKHKKTMP